MKKIIFYILVLAFYCSHAQESIEYLKVRNILITGNKKTKLFVIRREMTLHENDSFPAKSMDVVLLQNRLNIYNLNLFNDVSINIKNWEGDSLDLLIDLHERWTIIPTPIIAFADRNVSEWWKLHHHDFKRLQYGAQITWDNFTGRNDRFNFGMSFGFAQRMDIGYSIPHFNWKGQHAGFSLGLTMLRTKYVAYNTINDELTYLELGKSWQLKKIEVYSQVSYRKAIHTTHYFNLGYGYAVIGDSVVKANPQYFLDGRTSQHYFKVGYIFEVDYRNFKTYATDGWYFAFNLTNYGLGFMKTRMTTTGVQLSKYIAWKKHPRFTVAGMFKWQFSWPYKQPYNLQYVKSFGYDENAVRGYEINVIDGHHFLLLKNEYRFQLLDFQIKNMKKLQAKKSAVLNSSLAYLPLKFYLTAYFDAGYVWDNYFLMSNNLKNKWQFGFGAGLTLVTAGDKILRIEYSVNRYLQKGVYLHFEQPL
ncbi:MAG: outer membrane protein [Bacteroidota bacterium]|nr:outer membrane protein [Bacteroidota bacterium]